MNEDQLAVIHEAVQSHIGRPIEPLFNAKTVAFESRIYHLLKDAASAAVSTAGLPDLPQPELDLGIAIGRMGQSDSPPPLAVFQTLDDFRVQYGLEDPGRIVQMVVAYGSGWRRFPEGDGWEGYWDEAKNTLVDLIAWACNRVHVAFRRRALSYPELVAITPVEESVLDALEILRTLLHPFTKHDIPEQEKLRLVYEVSGDTGGPAVGLFLPSPEHLSEKIPIPSGSHQVLRLTEPALLLLERSDDPRGLEWPAGGRLIVQAGDCDARIDSPDASHPPGFVKLKPQERCEGAGPAHLETWTCRCGGGHCAYEHRLDAWDPGEAPLIQFVVRAVTGLPFRAKKKKTEGEDGWGWSKLHTNTFTRGMLAAQLATKGFAEDQRRLRVFQIEYRLCPVCDNGTKIWNYPHTTSCPVGHRLTASAPRRTEPLLGIDNPDIDNQVIYEKAERCKCGVCKELYELTPELLEEAAGNPAPHIEPTPCIPRLLQQARLIQRNRKDEGSGLFCWCPHCAAAGLHPARNMLPARATWVDLPQRGFMRFCFVGPVKPGEDSKEVSRSELMHDEQYTAPSPEEELIKKEEAAQREQGD